MCPSQVDVFTVIAVISLSLVGGDHVPDVVSLSEGSQYTYQYNCTHGLAELCHFYPGQITDFPIRIRGEEDLPDLLKGVMSLSEQQCSGNDSTIASFDNVIVLISGLILFYTPGGTCDIGNSNGPMPVLLSVIEGKLAHVNTVVSLSEGSRYTYDNNCTHGPAELCHYYPGQTPDFPIRVHGEEELPDLLKGVMSLSEQQCFGYDITIASFDNLTALISGLILFYTPDGSCDIGNSVGPRPVLLNMTEAPAQKCGDLNMTNDTINRQKMLSHQPLLHMIKEGQQLNYSCPCGPNVVVCVYNEQLDELQILTTSLIKSVRLEEHYCEGTLAQGPVAIIMGSLDVSEATFFCAENQCALHLSIGTRPLALQTVPTNNTCASTSESSRKYDQQFIPVVVPLAVFDGVFLAILVICILLLLIIMRKPLKSFCERCKCNQVGPIAA